MAFGKTLLAIFSTITIVTAQQLSHPLNPATSGRDDASSYPRTYRNFADTIDVIAVMVQFQSDSDTRTSGNGQFDLSTPADVGLDSPPHTKRYFDDHLTFLANYFRKVSKGKTIIRATLVDTVYGLAQNMSRYSPPKTGPNTAVGDLSRDTWTLVSSSGKVQDFSRYDCFVVFHAGVGRDVDVVATLGFDPTPLDIPSLYLGLNAFKSFYGQTYDGIPVRNNFRITNTIVIPETETRELPATPNNVLLRLGINGLLCASVGNFLGLPDLFNTADGRSGIGRFGLMDGQAIFSFAGAFPPEPSAWEKYWLGWIQPIVVAPQDTTTKAFPAVSMNDRPDRIDTVYRVPVSASEYFLLENRNRDWARNGQRVTISYNGTISQRSYQRDTVGFNAFSLTDIRGNILDVEDFDWSLPGGVGSQTNEFFDGGILIWHIDESVIAVGIAANGVNANPRRRGVDLEEADGSQDIGQQYGQLEPGSGSEEGTVFDFWFQGNIAPVYRNEFSATSYPNNAGNSGANSHFAIKEFSRRGTRMTATVMVGDDVSLLTGFPKQVGSQLAKPSLTVANIGATSSLALIVTTTRGGSTRPSRNQTSAVALAGQVYAWKTDGTPVLRSELFAWSGGQVPFSGSPYIGAPAVADFNSNNVADVIVADASSNGGTLHVYQSSPRTLDSLAIEILSLQLAKRLTTSPLITDSVVAVGAARSTVYVISRGSNKLDSLSIVSDTSDVVGLAAIGDPKTFIYTTVSGKIASSSGIFSPLSLNNQAVGAPIFGRLGAGKQVIVTASKNGVVNAVEFADGTTQPSAGFSVHTGESINASPALADIDGDGIREIVVFAGNKIYAYNYAGASLDNFPKLVLSSKSISSNPVVADVDGDGDVDIVAVTEDGFVVAYDKNGTMANGFPLQAGVGNQSVAAFTLPGLALAITNICIAVASSDDGSVTAWHTGTIRGNRQPQIPWGQYQRDAQHSGLAIEQISGSPISSAFFPKERAYNWPNPVYDGKTFIRYFVGENATVKIKILDLAGDLVTEFAGPGVGGVDNEIEWNVKDVQSGVYLARIEANGGGKTETAVVKVAVVK